MRSLKLAAAVVAALALVPAAASATTYEGNCDDIAGTAKFGTPLKAASSANTYDFTGKAHCTGKIDGKAITAEPVTIRVAGKGELSCSQGKSTEDGIGTITTSNGTVIRFKMTFTATLSEVDITLKGWDKGTGEGSASFLNRTDPAANLTTVQNCEGEGNKELSFTAKASTTTPFEDKGPAQSTTTSAGSQQPAGPSGSSGGGSQSTDSAPQNTSGSSQPDTTTSQEPGVKSQPNKKKSKKKSKKKKSKKSKKKSKKGKKKGKKRG